MLAVEVLLGAAVASSHAKYAIVAVLGIPAFMLIMRHPFGGACLLMALVAGFITDEVPKLTLGGTHIFPGELVLGILLIAAIARPRRQTWGGSLGLGLGLFLGWLLLSSVLAIQSGAGTLNEVELGGRVFFMLAFFWVVIRLFPEREQVMRLLTAAAVIGAVTGVVALLLAVHVPPHDLLLKPAATVIYQGGSGGFLRTRLPGLALSFILLWIVVWRLAHRERPSWVWWLCLLGAITNVLVSLNRNMWVASLIGFALVLLVTGPRVRGRIVAGIVVLGAGISLFLLVPPTQEPTAKALNPVVQRGATLFTGNVAEEQSLQDRSNETAFAWRVAQRHLAFGVAPGVSWGLYDTSFQNGTVVVEPQLFLHNQYLYLLLIAGIPGALFFVAFLVGAVVRGLSGGRSRPELAMLGIGLLTLMVTAAVMLSLSSEEYILAIALVAGSIFALKAEPGGAR